MKTASDVRQTNWWYVLPPVVGRVLVIGDSDQAEAFPDHVVVPAERDAVTDALRTGSYGGVAVPDLDGLIAAEGDGLGVLRSLVAAVGSTGWVYAGFSNRPFRKNALSVAKLRGVLSKAGMDDIRLYLAAPDHVTPAYLIPAERSAEADFFMRTLFFPYSTSSGPRAMGRRFSLRVLRAGAWVSSPSLRARAWPSIAFTARRPA